MIREIGSEFWQQEQESIIEMGNIACLLSGRTALDFIIRDIKSSKVFKSVLLPSYCCDSMIEPFIRNGILVHFYIVNENEIIYNTNNCDVVLLIDYFGYIDDRITEIAEIAKHNGQIVIYDSTHYLGHREIKADYIFCSYRKWTYSNFAHCEKTCGKFTISVPNKTNEYYLKLRNAAAALKSDFINGISEAKSEFQEMYGQAEELLNTDYVNYSGKVTIIDKESIIKSRKDNAKRLINGLEGIKEIKVWKNFINEQDTPLFVPILIPNEIRIELRKHLNAHKIYCPIHWPLTNIHGDYRAIYENELSLVCDQRYSSEDVDREIEAIWSFFAWRNNKCL